MTGGAFQSDFQPDFQSASGTVLTGFLSIERVIYGSKSPGSTMISKPPFNFVSYMDPNDTIISAVVNASVFSGTDPSPGSIISGSPVISGTTVAQAFTGGVVGVIYEITCLANISNGETFTQSGFLAIKTDLVA